MLMHCVQCAEEIDADIHPETPEGHMCFDCHFDYVILGGRSATPRE